MTQKIKYSIQNQLELNLSYMPFITDGGLFIPTKENFSLGDLVLIDLQLPGKKESQEVEGKVIWVTPNNALYEIEQGIGIQFTANNDKNIHQQVTEFLDKSMDEGGYTCGVVALNQEGK